MAIQDARTTVMINGAEPGRFQLDLPLSTAQVMLKQLQRQALSDRADKLLAEFFPRFQEPASYAADLRRRGDELDINTDVPINGVLGQPRRFAADDTLPRSRYYTIAQEDGDDRGTLIRELLAYHDPQGASTMQLSEVVLRDQGIVSDVVEAGFRIPSAERALKVRVAASGVQELIPLSVSGRTIERVLDLRSPDVADQFAQVMTALRWPNGIQIYPLKPRVETFGEILPTILGQELGGPMFCKIAGHALRDSGCDGLIYPSARSDCGVLVRDGAVQRAWGWCFVDFAESHGPIGGIAFVDHRSEWPRQVGRGGGIGLGDHGPGESCPGIRLTYEDGGPHRGSWNVSGIEARLRNEVAAAVDTPWPAPT